MPRLADLGAPVSRMVDIQPVLSDVLRTVCDLVRADRGTFVLHDGQSDRLTVAAVVALDDEQASALDGPHPRGGPTAAALAGGRPVLVADVTTDPVAEPWREVAARIGFRSAYLVPLLTVGEEAVGVIGAYWDAPHRPDPREEELVAAYARQAADMVERARLHGEARALAGRERQRAAQLRQLADAALELATVEDQPALLRAVTEAARRIVGTRRATTCRLSGGWDCATVHTSVDDRPSGEDPAGRDGWPGERAAAEAVVHANAPLRLPARELADDPRWGGADGPDGGYLGVPLVGRDGANLGLVEVRGRLDGTDFGPEDESIVVQLARMAATALERLELVERDRAARESAERLARRYRLLSEAGEQLSASLELSEALRTVARLVVPTLADWCALDLLGDDDALERVHVVAADHLDAGPDELADGPGAAPAVALDRSAGGAAEALRTGESRLYPVVPDDVLVAVAGDEATFAAMRDSATRTGLVVPLRARGQLIGALTLLRFAGRPYTGDDLALVEELAGRAAQAIDNASRFAFERDLAATLQRSLLPQALPVAPGIDVASRYLPGASGTQVGGDWYDLIDLGQGRLALVIGDVMGRGVAAATVMGQLRATVRAYALEGHEPAELLRRVDRVVQTLDESQLTTCIYAVYDTSTRDLTLATAGHLPPLVVDASGPHYLELEPGVPLGVGDTGFSQTRVPLAPGSTVLLYTDGLVEGPDCPIGTGMELLLAAVREAPGNAEALCDHLLHALGRDGDHDDDTALLAVSLTSADGRDPHEPAELTLPLDPESAATARGFVARTLAERGLSRHRDVAVLLASELVTNALRHARTDVRVRVATTAERLRVEVVDGSGQVPLPRHAIPDQDESGRGMLLVAGLSDRWGTEPGFGGKCVWFELDT